MISSLHLKGIIALAFLILLIVAPGQLASGSPTAPALQESSETARLDRPQLLSPLYQNPASNGILTAIDCSATTCPSGPTDLDKCVERPKFCVYYTTDSISEMEAEWAADTVQDYWDRFSALGFLEPKYSTKLKVELSDTRGAGSNVHQSGGPAGHRTACQLMQGASMLPY